MRKSVFWATPLVCLSLFSSAALAECSTLKDCSAYDVNTTTGLINSTICGIYNFFACIGSPLMMFVFMVLGATIIASVFGLAYYILSKRT